MSNGRTGSTWLTTLLNACPDILTRGEVKWDPRAFKPAGHHIVLSRDSADVGELLQQKALTTPAEALRGIRIYGSKFVFDPHHFLDQRTYDFIGQSIPPDVRVVHLRRPYIEVFLSFNARGPVHKVARGPIARQAAKLDHDLIDAMLSMNPDHAQTKLIYVAKRRLDVLVLRRFTKDDNVIVFSLADFLQEIANYFFHDVQTVSLMKARGDSFFLEYSDIEKRLGELATYLGSGANCQDTKNALEGSCVEKLPDLHYELAWPTQMVKYICDIFYDELTEFITADKRLDDIVRWNAQRRTYTIISPRLRAFMEMSAAAWRRRLRPIFWLGPNAAVNMRPTKPIRYVDD